MKFKIGKWAIEFNIKEIKELTKRERDVKIALKEPVKIKFKQGQRVIANELAGFHRGMKGVIKFVEPKAAHDNDGLIWVLRDGSDGPVYYYPFELDYEPSPFPRS